MGFFLSLSRRESTRTRSPALREGGQSAPERSSLCSRGSDAAFFPAMLSSCFQEDTRSMITEKAGAPCVPAFPNSLSSLQPSAAGNTSTVPSLERVVQSFQWSRDAAISITAESTSSRKQKRSETGAEAKNIHYVPCDISGNVFNGTTERGKIRRIKNLAVADQLRSSEEPCGMMEHVHAQEKYGSHGHFYGTLNSSASHGLALVWSVSKTPLTALSLISLCRVGSSTRKKIMLVDEVDACGVVLTYENDF